MTYLFKLDVLLKRANAAEITAMEASSTLDEVTNQIVSMAALLLGHRKRLKCTTQLMVQDATVCLTKEELADLRLLVSPLIYRKNKPRALIQDKVWGVSGERRLSTNPQINSQDNAKARKGLKIPCKNPPKTKKKTTLESP